jgi:hypothetical protein
VKKYFSYISREVKRIKYFNERRNGEHEDIATVSVLDSDMLEDFNDEELEEDFKSYLKLESQLLEQLAT